MSGEKMKRCCRMFSLISALLVMVALIPVPSRAMDMKYGDWEIDGFLRNNTGVWTENWEYAPNNDPLATCRNWFRLNVNGKISNSLKLKAEVLAVYEPEYSRERGGGIAANTYNYFDFREMRLDWRPAMGHNIRIGKQIVNWGESISARVGDVINPTDARFDLGFTNLEDTRMPIWMLRGLHQFYAVGTSVDWVFSPYMEPDRYRVSRTLAWAPGNIDASGVWNGTSAMRFTPAPETRIYIDGVGYLASSQAFGAGGAGTGPVFWAPINQALYKAIGGGLYAPVGAPGGLELPFDYPDSNLKDSRYGFKTSSTLAGFQTGVYFWRAHVHTPPVLYYRGLTSTGAAKFDVVYERQNVFGFYANKNYDFGVVRLDTAYRPGYDYQTDLVSKYPDMVCDNDNLMVQLGYNKDFMWRALNKDQTFGLTAEYVGEYLLKDTDGALIAFPWHIQKPRDSHTFMAQLGTNYNFGMYAPSMTVIYNLRNNGLLQPSFTYSPDWMNRKWKFTLQYNAVFGDNNFDVPYGIMREKDMVVLTTQFSFP